jgi:hypothetical protein
MSGSNRQQAYRERQKEAGRESLHTRLDPETQPAWLCDELDTERSAVITRAIELLHKEQELLNNQQTDPVAATGVIVLQHRRRRQAYTAG